MAGGVAKRSPRRRGASGAASPLSTSTACIVLAVRLDFFRLACGVGRLSGRRIGPWMGRGGVERARGSGWGPAGGRGGSVVTPTHTLSRTAVATPAAPPSGGPLSSTPAHVPSLGTAHPALTLSASRRFWQRLSFRRERGVRCGVRQGRQPAVGEMTRRGGGRSAPGRCRDASRWRKDLPHCVVATH